MKTIKIGAGTPSEREVEIIEFVQAVTADGRVACITRIEGAYALTFDNLPESGREPHNEMLLSDESFSLMIAVMSLYFAVKDLDSESLFGRVTFDDVAVNCSEHLAPKIWPNRIK